MKTYKVKITEEFIKEAHEVACDEWKTKIKDLVPAAFGPKKGWYKDIEDKSVIINYNSFTDYRKNYGINGGWTNVFGFINFDKKVPATDKEVEEALIKEAKKRGLVMGIKVKSVSLNCIEEIKRNSYFLHDNCFFVNNGIYENICIMKDGVWAEPIETSTLKRIEEIEAELKLLKSKL